jgi:hypothetical protein
MVAPLLKLAAETVIFAFSEPATTVDGETEVIVGSSFVAEVPTQLIITEAIESVDKTKQIRYMSSPPSEDHSQERRSFYSAH